MSFGDFETAAQMREAITTIVQREIKRLRPETRVARVVSVNREKLTAEVSFAGDEGTLNARFGLSLIPRGEGDLVRVAGKVGDYYITEILNGTGAHADYEPIKDKVESGDFVEGPLPPPPTLEDFFPGGLVGTIHLADDAVNADKIDTLSVSQAILVSGAVTETVIADDAISTPKLKTNIIETHHLKSNAVTANKLLVAMGGGNLLTNSSWNNSTSFLADWQTLGTVTQETTTTRDGRAASVNAGSGNTVYRDYTGLVVGQKYTFSAWARSVGGTGGYLRCDDTGGGNVVSSSTTNSADTWQRLSVVYTATTTSVRVYCYAGSSVRTIFDQAQLEEGDVLTAWNPRAEELLPGTIKAVMLDANAVRVGGTGSAITFETGYDPSVKATISDLTLVETKIDAGDNYLLNAFFDVWPSGQTYPTGYQAGAGSAPTKETTTFRTAPHALSYAVPSGTNTYMQPSNGTIPDSSFVTIRADVYLVSGSWNGSGVLVRWQTSAGSYDALVKFSEVLAGKGTGAWWRVETVVPRPSAYTGTFQNITVWPIGGWTGFESITAKTIIFDQMSARPSSVEEIKAWTAGLWIYPGTTTINGGLLQTGTVLADNIRAGMVITNNANVASTLTVGTVSLAGTIESYNFTNATTGWQLGKTGFTLKSGSTGSIQLSSSGGLQAIDSGGTTTFSISASTGDVEMKGNLKSGSTISGAVINGGSINTAQSGTGTQIRIGTNAASLNTIEFYGTTGSKRGSITLDADSDLVIKGPSSNAMIFNETNVVVTGGKLTIKGSAPLIDFDGGGGKIQVPGGHISFATNANIAGRVGNDTSNSYAIFKNGAVLFGNASLSPPALGDGTNYVTAYANQFLGKTAAATFSDRKFKDNIAPLASRGVDIIKTIKPKQFTMTDDKDKKLRFGFIAQEIQEILPEAVQVMESGALAMTYDTVYTINVLATQELIHRIELLEAKIKEMKA